MDENLKKKRLSTRKKYKDKDIEAAAKSIGMSYSGFRKRMDKEGLTIEEALALGTKEDVRKKQAQLRSKRMQNDKLHVGEVFIFSDGTRGEVVENYGKDIIKFKYNDGTIVDKTRYATLAAGYKPGGRALTKYKYLGKTFKTNCGLSATVTQYFSLYDIEIQFEDGAIAHCRPGNLICGSVKHPYLSGLKVAFYNGYEVHKKNKIILEDSTIYYPVIDPKGNKFLMTPQEMITNPAQ